MMRIHPQARPECLGLRYLQPMPDIFALLSKILASSTATCSYGTDNHTPVIYMLLLPSSPCLYCYFCHQLSSAFSTVRPPFILRECILVVESTRRYLIS